MIRGADNDGTPLKYTYMKVSEILANSTKAYPSLEIPYLHLPDGCLMVTDAITLRQSRGMMLRQWIRPGGTDSYITTFRLHAWI